MKITLKQQVYAYGKCHCCGKKFSRTTRGSVFGFSADGKYYLPINRFDGDTQKEYHFGDVPADIVLTKVGEKCTQDLYDKGITVE